MFWFIYALSVADQYIKTGMYKNILVIGAFIRIRHDFSLVAGFSDFGDGQELQFEQRRFD
jgi:3-oxoacyl-[acyl-carrier-protein] synthase III